MPVSTRPKSATGGRQKGRRKDGEDYGPGFDTRGMTGIPEYNALLDKNLGARRSYLLRNRASVRLLQKTGCIEVPKQKEEWVVNVKALSAKRKLERPQTALGTRTPGKDEKESYSVKKSSPSRKEKKNTLASKKSTTKASKEEAPAEEKEDIKALQKELENGEASLNLPPEKEENETLSASKSKPGTDRSFLRKSFSCSHVGRNSEIVKGPARKSRVPKIKTTAETLADVRNNLRKISTLQQRNKSIVIKSNLQKQRPKEKPSTVEALLKQDGIFQNRIDETQDQIEALTEVKEEVEKRTLQMRQHIQGVNAVQENDQAVKHISSIMQGRIVKAEHAYMKSITKNTNLKQDIDDARRELLAIAKVHDRLQAEDRQVEHQIQAMRKTIREHHDSRVSLETEIASVEREAEEKNLERLHQLRLTGNQENVDIARLVRNIYDRAIKRHTGRRLTRVDRQEYKLRITQNALKSAVKANYVEKINENVAKYEKAFGHIQKELGIYGLNEFLDSFVELETELLSNYKLLAATQTEKSRLERLVRQTDREINEKDQRIFQTEGEHDKELQLLQAELDEVLASTAKVEKAYAAGVEQQESIRSILTNLLDSSKLHKQTVTTCKQELSLTELVGFVQQKLADSALGTHFQASKTTGDNGRAPENTQAPKFFGPTAAPPLEHLQEYLLDSALEELPNMRKSTLLVATSDHVVPLSPKALRVNAKKITEQCWKQLAKREHGSNYLM